MNQPTLNKIESDARMPSILFTKKIADALGVTLDGLIGDTLPSGSTASDPGQAIPLVEDLSRRLTNVSRRLESIESEAGQVPTLVEQLQKLRNILLSLIDVVVLKPPQRRSLREQIARVGGDPSK